MNRTSYISKKIALLQLDKLTSKYINQVLHNRKGKLLIVGAVAEIGATKKDSLLRQYILQDANISTSAAIKPNKSDIIFNRIFIRPSIKKQLDQKKVLAKQIKTDVWDIPIDVIYSYKLYFDLIFLNHIPLVSSTSYMTASLHKLISTLKYGGILIILTELYSANDKALEKVTSESKTMGTFCTDLQIIKYCKFGVIRVIPVDMIYGAFQK